MTDTPETLTERDRAMLALERMWWQYAGAKEQKVRDQFGVSMTTYYARINRLIDREDALAYDPLLVKRLRRLRDERKRSRTLMKQMVGEVMDVIDDGRPSR
jgi:hypothetical protein